MEIQWNLFIVLFLFILFLVIVAKDVMDRAALVIIFALLTYAVVILTTDAPMGIIIDFLIGTEADGYVNIHAILLIFGMSIISFYCQKSGLFQFMAFKIIQGTKGEANKIMLWNSMLGFFVSAILADSITAIILIPLTVSICRTLKLKPVPFLIVQAIFIKLGATIMPISSIPSIMITAHQGITFVEYLSFAGVVSLGVSLVSAFIFSILYSRKHVQAKLDGINMFLEYNAWTFVKDKPYMIKIALAFLGTIIAFITIPADVLGVDSIGLIGAGVTLFISRNKKFETFKEIEFDLLVYLLSVFVITGCLEYVGVVDMLGNFLTGLNISEPAFAFIILLWVGAIASAFIDNIPIMQLFLSLINILLGPKGTDEAKLGSMGLSVGIIWGDNFSPFGDSILALQIAQNHGVKIDPMEFFKVGATTTTLQLVAVSLVILTIYRPIFIIVDIILVGVLIAVFTIRGKKKGTQDQVESDDYEEIN